ncbi:hypothetical protein L486_03424 [Kwoniella mangroviensis CBS 10435]|uniref:Uncharacterized protein n=1 Tax=Kwoniella mangroviensis CBS 10435 TaxID=1331196 RepID=A0A1B9ITR8_9TREE|nr:hypothetical protein L486_03424 [Kwoniella mangroviensis CBS 10435]
MSSTTYDPTPLSPSSPRQLPKLRLMLSTSTTRKPSRGHKRHREDSIEVEDEDQPREEKRPTIKLRSRNPTPSSSIKTKKDSPAHTTLTSTPTYISPFGELSGSSSRMDIDTTSRPSTPTPTLNYDTQSGLVTKRPRSYSNSSSIIGLLVDETDTTSSSPIDGNGSTSATIIPSTPNLSSSNKPHSHIHIPSPLASTPILGVPLEPPSLSRAVSDPSPSSSFSRDIDMNPSPVLTPGPIDGKLTKTRHKLFMAEVEALGTEMNNVFKLGYGRGMGRALGVGVGGRGPSRLRSGLQAQIGGHKDWKSMEVDE